MQIATAAEMPNARPEAVIWRGADGVIDRCSGPMWGGSGWELYEPWMEHYRAGSR